MADKHNRADWQENVGQVGAMHAVLMSLTHWEEAVD